MLTRITGRLEALHGTVATIVPRVGDGDLGLAYGVHVPAALAETLDARVGEVIALHTIQIMEPQGGGTSFVPRLIGFETTKDRQFFELFTTVKGVGSRKALRALIMPMTEVAHAIFDRDAAKLRTMPEIGTRLAATIIAELHGKVDPYLVDLPDARPTATIESSASGGTAQQAVEALVRLGEAPAEARRKVDLVMRGTEESLSADDILARTFEVS